MVRFDRVLLRVDRELDVREPERSRILLELAVDLDGLYREYRRRGCSVCEARRRAARWLEPDPEAIRRLGDLHAPPLLRLLSPLSEVARSRFAAVVLVLVASVSIAGGLWALRSSPMLWPPGPAVIGIVVLGALGVWIAGRGALDILFSSRGGGSHDEVFALPVLAAVSAIAGTLGGLVHLFRALESPPPGAGSYRFPWTEVSSAAGIVTLGLAVAVGLVIVWLWLAVRIGVVQRARAEFEQALASLGKLEARGDEGRSR